MNEEKNERKQYLDGLKRYRERGIPIYMDGQISNPKDWERLFEIREECFIWGITYRRMQEN